MHVILITGIKNEFDEKLAVVFARNNHTVYTMGEKKIDKVVSLPLDMKQAFDVIQKDSGHIDIYIDVSDERSPSDNFNVRTGLNDEVIHKLYEANVINPMRMLETFFPLLEASGGKRLCFLTSAEASINETQAVDGLGYKMAKAGLHNFLQITRNVLAPKGYTLRAFDPICNNVPAGLSASDAAEGAYNYFSRGRGVERGDPHRDDETNLVFRDANGRQHSW